MTTRDARQWAGGVVGAVRHMFDRLLGRKGPEPATSPGAVPGLDDDEYTLFEGSTLRLHQLSTDQLDELRPDPNLAPGAFRIRIARSRDYHEPAVSLVRRRYASRGYQIPIAKKIDPHLFTFVAYNYGELVGTVGLRLDSQLALAADQLYRVEIDTLRSREARICEFTRLAIDASAGSKSVLAGLFHTAYLFARRVRALDSAVIEVNPRHVVFYQRALGFEVVGPERHNPRVDAPAVLLCVRFETVAEGLAKYAGKPDLATSTRTLFPYGFSPKDEEGILGRLRAFSDSASSATV
jgi:hypothetical protein